MRLTSAIPGPRLSSRDYLTGTGTVTCPGCGTTDVLVELTGDQTEQHPAILTFDDAGRPALGYRATATRAWLWRRRLRCATASCRIEVDMQPADLLLALD